MQDTNASVPNRRDAYRDQLDLATHGLFEAPRVTVYGGLIFATWDADAKSLETFLGDACWYLDNFLIREEMGGVVRTANPNNGSLWRRLEVYFRGDGARPNAGCGDVSFAPLTLALVCLHVGQPAFEGR